MKVIVTSALNEKLTANFLIYQLHGEVSLWSWFDIVS